jgi:hypothetical protein
VRNSSVLLVSLREISEAYQQALLDGVDLEFWKHVYCERLVMLCDSIEHRGRTVQVDGNEQARGGGVI